MPATAPTMAVAVKKLRIEAPIRLIARPAAARHRELAHDCVTLPEQEVMWCAGRSRRLIDSCLDFRTNEPQTAGPEAAGAAQRTKPCPPDRVGRAS
ncbi:hypothetical protein GOOTI_154_00110 [Gordonia otitidis NBRC 100426]|uniref:Uncharacterized protein n=1 Tax=Gordonia otitidis (strain DSM 44809 / CCUG 52243 / JCM 12355 / NBRC 100426 / IFM 10032) TaxID=1108044 RepID=H5TPB6_GORO1|nr:hypothetical protein GOOTI_154_00110 [Gordonia otitidis NBRC 100426]